jgi:hypothetical protein
MVPCAFDAFVTFMFVPPTMVDKAAVMAMMLMNFMVYRYVEVLLGLSDE